jgi:hypothetical protein
MGELAGGQHSGQRKSKTKRKRKIFASGTG